MKPFRRRILKSNGNTQLAFSGKENMAVGEAEKLSTIVGEEEAIKEIEDRKRERMEDLECLIRQQKEEEKERMNYDPDLNYEDMVMRAIAEGNGDMFGL